MQLELTSPPDLFDRDLWTGQPAFRVLQHFQCPPTVLKQLHHFPCVPLADRAERDRDRPALCKCCSQDDASPRHFSLGDIAQAAKQYPGPNVHQNNIVR